MIGDPLTLTTTTMADGGDAVARDADGRVIFVEGALPGETVSVSIIEEGSRFARGTLTAVLEAGPDRIDPECPEVAHGCGGCGWAHVDSDSQRRFKAESVAEAVRRIGGLEPPPIDLGPVLATTGFRTTVRAAVHEGRAGFRRPRSHEVVPIESCRVAHPRIEQLLVEGRWGDATEVTLRVGVATNEAMAMVSPSNDDLVLPTDVRLVGTDELAAGRRVWIHDEINGARFRISARSFFQGRADGAAALIDAVSAAVVGSPARAVDLCCGVGLFAAVLPCRSVIGVESNRSAVADARVNIDRGGQGSRRVVSSRFESWTPSRADLVVADPARDGLGKVGVAKAVATGARQVILVSCRSAAAGRDIGLFAAAGYTPVSMKMVDLFPDTPHMEVVTSLIKE